MGIVQEELPRLLWSRYSAANNNCHESGNQKDSLGYIRPPLNGNGE